MGWMGGEGGGVKKRKSYTILSFPRRRREVARARTLIGTVNASNFTRLISLSLTRESVRLTGTGMAWVKRRDNFAIQRDPRLIEAVESPSSTSSYTLALALSLPLSHHRTSSSPRV